MPYSCTRTHTLTHISPRENDSVNTSLVTTCVQTYMHDAGTYAHTCIASQKWPWAYNLFVHTNESDSNTNCQLFVVHARIIHIHVLTRKNESERTLCSSTHIRASPRRHDCVHTPCSCAHQRTNAANRQSPRNCNVLAQVSLLQEQKTRWLQIVQAGVQGSWTPCPTHFTQPECLLTRRCSRRLSRCITKNQ